MKEFKSLGHSEKLGVISERLNKRRNAYEKNTYNIEWLENRFEKLHNFFEERNSEIEKQDGYINRDSYISKDDLYVMLYDYPTLLTTSIQGRLKPIMNKLDNELLNSYFLTSIIIKANPSILCSSILRTSLQVKILKDTNTLSFAIERPRIFRTAPELMYALIEKWKSNNLSKTPFLTNQRLEKTYGVSKESLQKSYDIREKYGDDEYFKEI